MDVARRFRAVASELRPLIVAGSPWLQMEERWGVQLSRGFISLHGTRIPAPTLVD
eukprot:gene2453-56540_t